MSRKTIETLLTPQEIAVAQLYAHFNVKPEAQWFYCIFVFSVQRESPSALRLKVVSSTVSHTHKYTITAGLLQAAPEITDRQDIGVELFVQHLKADHDLNISKYLGGPMSNYTRSFMDNGLGNLPAPPEFVLRDLDYDPEEKLGPVLVQ